MKKIALDFDDTYTAMPVIWDQFIRSCKAAGHVVTIVTARQPASAEAPRYNEDIELVCKQHGISFVCTSGDQKADHFKADIWIDDNPDWIPKMSLIESMATMNKWANQ